MKSVVAVFGGIFAAIVVIFLIEMISQSLYPPPLGIDLKNKQVMDDWIKTLPVGASIIVLCGWFLGAFAGSAVVSYLDREKAKQKSMLIGAILLGFTLMTLIEINHPLWMWIGGVVAIIVGAFFGCVCISMRNRLRAIG